MDITVLGSATAQTIGQRIEDVRTFAGETVSISCMVKGTLTGAVTLNLLQNFGTGGSPSATVTTAVGTYTPTASWVRKTFTVAVPSITGKTLGSTADTHYLELQFDAGNKTGQLDIWGVQLEQNTTATILEREPIAQTLAKCQRYYFRFAAGNQYQRFGWGFFSSSGSGQGITQLPVSLRSVIVPPTLDYSGTFDCYDFAGAATSVSAFTALTSQCSPITIALDLTVSGAVSGRGFTFRATSTNSYLGFSAEL